MENSCLKGDFDHLKCRIYIPTLAVDLEFHLVRGREKQMSAPNGDHILHEEFFTDVVCVHFKGYVCVVFRTSVNTDLLISLNLSHWKKWFIPEFCDKILYNVSC